MKNYLVYINSGVGAEMQIIFEFGLFRVFYCNRDTGRAYLKLGNAARYLEKIAGRYWGPDTVKVYGNVADIPNYGGPAFN